MKKRIAVCIFLILLISGNLSATVTLIMKHHDAAVGSQVTVPVRVKDFINIISAQGTINFDPNIISFVSVQQFGLPGMNAGSFGTPLIGSGKLTFSWYEASLIPQTLADSTIIFSIKFNVTGTNGQISNLTFSDVPTTMEVVNNTFASQSLTLVSGAVHVNNVVTPFDLSLVIDNKTGITGSQLSLPVKGVNFKNINSFQGTIIFDTAVVSFVGTGSYNLSGLSSSNFGLTQISNGKLMFAWNDASLLGQNITDSGTIFSILFDLVGNPGSSTTVSFSSSPTPIELTDSLSHILNPDLVSGNVTIANNSGNQQLTLDIDSVSATSGLQVVVPVRAFDFTNIYSMQGTITFNNSVATFASVEQFGLTGMDNSNFGTTLTSSGKLMFAWSDPALTGQSRADSSILFAIRFNVVGAIGTTSIIDYTNSPTPAEFIDNNINTLSYILKPGKIIVTALHTGYNISGKTRYAGKANPGNPVPNIPSYEPVKYDINNVLVILKTYPGLVEVARDTSDNLGYYSFSGITDGSYLLSYDKLTSDTMQMVNEVTAIDVSLMKYLIGSDTTTDPSKNFSWIYKKAANVNNSPTITAIDVAIIKAKIGLPYDPSKNFPKGNWVNLDTIINVSGADIYTTLKIIGYGDFNASSTKYRDSINTWSLLKTTDLNNEIIIHDGNFFNTGGSTYFEIPLRINKNIKDFSSLGLELNYPKDYFKLIKAEMPMIKSGYQSKSSNCDIVTDSEDLLVTDHEGVIRVVFATTNHFDIYENDEILTLGFLINNNNDVTNPEFSLSGTGEIGNMSGEKIEDGFLLMHNIIISYNKSDKEDFELAGYPNPFTEKAFISYNLNSETYVNLSVYNILGEKVSEIFNGYQSSGKQTLVFSKSNLPSGIYTFKLEYSCNDSAKIFIIKMIK